MLRPGQIFRWCWVYMWQRLEKKQQTVKTFLNFHILDFMTSATPPPVISLPKGSTSE
ncbi:MAG: hypothetical protein ACI8PB_000341 [Desulforhopalus sp.]|jgi:hypothetical protein